MRYLSLILEVFDCHLNLVNSGIIDDSGILGGCVQESQDQGTCLVAVQGLSYQHHRITKKGDQEKL